MKNVYTQFNEIIYSNICLKIVVPANAMRHYFYLVFNVSVCVVVCRWWRIKQHQEEKVGMVKKSKNMYIVDTEKEREKNVERAYTAEERNQ